MSSHQCPVRNAALACVTAFFPLLLLAQSDSAINGRVTDPSGAAIAGAKVQATNVNTNVVATSESNEAGLFSLPALNPGTYRVAVDKEGFQQSINPGVELHVGDNIWFAGAVFDL